MNFKKITIFILLIAVLACGGVAFYYYRNSVINSVKDDKEKQQEKISVAIEDKTIVEKTNQFDISVTYPVVLGLDDFNKKAKDYVDQQLTDFKKTSLENDQAIKEVDPESYAKNPRSYYLSITLEKGQVDENAISIVFNVSNFTGGAHGANYFYALNYDVKNKKEIKLADLFSGQSDYLQKISDYCLKDLTKQINTATENNADENWIKEGTAPTEENYSIFLINPLTDSGSILTFYFPQYQVGPYAIGSYKVDYTRYYPR